MKCTDNSGVDTGKATISDKIRPIAIWNALGSNSGIPWWETANYRPIFFGVDTTAITPETEKFPVADKSDFEFENRLHSLKLPH
jgi:hypothetical protein